MNDCTERTKKVKQALTKIFNYKDVSVTNGTGTAYGWVNVNIKTDLPKDCKCKIVNDNGYSYRKPLDDNRMTYFCEACDKLHKETKEKAMKAIKDISFGTYYADDGYNTARDQLLIDVNVGKLN